MADIDYIAGMCERAFNRGSLMSFLQELALNFYPERATFTGTPNIGTNFASNLTTSMPILARRDMGDMFSSMLRPTDLFWFKIQTDNQEFLDYESKLWLQQASKAQWGGMYDPKAKFQRATKQGDHDYVTFGQCVISKEWNYNTGSLIYKCWHIRDVAWYDDANGDACPIFRKWKATPYELMQEFKGNLSKEIIEFSKDPKKMFEPVEIRHAVIKADMAKGKKYKTPYVSIYYEEKSRHVLREEGVWTKIYTIPRWQTVSDSQYSYSPATIASLPDARLMQQMTLVLLEAGEKAVNPPLAATQEALRSDVNMMAGGITYLDIEYDERMGAALQPMAINTNGIGYGLQMREEIKKSIEAAFYLDKIGLPPMGVEMTRYETAERIKEYSRKIIPLFSPIEAEYNAGICEDTFQILLKADQFGSVNEIPQGLRGKDIKFQFRSPLSENLDRQKVQSFNEAKQMLAEVLPLDQSIARMVDIRKAMRDVFENGLDLPMGWLRDEEELKAMDEADMKKQQQQEMMGMMSQGADVGKTMSEGVKNFSQAQAVG